MKTPQYDVALTFLRSNEATALRISDELRDRRSVFVYPEQQSALVGKSEDGVVGFSEVFREDCRVCVILHSKGWGDTGYTRIEATAIKERALSVGWDFLLVVCLDASHPPKWIPSVKIWYGFEKYGMTGLVAAIDYRVTELGGAPRTDSLIEKAARTRREHEFEQARQRFAASVEGVRRVSEEVQRLRDLFADRVKVLQPVSPHLQLRFEKNDHPYSSAAVSSASRSVVVYWMPQYSNVLHGAALVINEWGGPFSFHAAGGPPKLATMSAVPDIDYAHRIVWRVAKHDEFTSEALVDFLLGRLIDDDPPSRRPTGYATVVY